MRDQHRRTARSRRSRKANRPPIQRKTQPARRSHDKELYKARHLVENFFGKLKELKRIALRAGKINQSFEAMISLAAALLNSR
jgi:transposase